MLLASACPPGVDARGAESVVDSLLSMPESGYSATFTVGMPQLPEDVVYHIRFSCLPNPSDTLMPARYLIDWSVEDAPTPFSGFTAYFDGNHFRFSGEKLQEYHVASDLTPFLQPASRPGDRAGVQRTAQFANLLPSEMAADITHLMSDSITTINFVPDTVIGGEVAAYLKAVTKIKDETVSERSYVLDPHNLFPKRIQIENNPGAISEQTINIEFSKPDEPFVETIDENSLLEMYPDIFSKMRQSNFRLENLIGLPLPGFSLPTPTGERYSRMTHDRFASATVLALIDPSKTFSRKLIQDLRDAVASSPLPLSLIMAFNSNNADMIEEITGMLRSEETILQSAKSLCRDLGAATLPAIILIKEDGTVADVIIGYNNELAADVIQKTTLKCK